MTSFTEPNFSYTEATLRREVHTDNSHWELMYKAMLAQLMTYVDAAVARALAEHGIDESFVARTQASARAAAQSYAQSGYAAEAASGARTSQAEPHRYEPGMGGPFSGVVLPPWLQPFTLPEQVRFTRTPDALLHRPAPDAETDDQDDGSSMAAPAGAGDAVPTWKKPVVLPANVRFNRTPYPKPFESGEPQDDETVGAQTFTGEGEAVSSDIPAPDAWSQPEGVVIALADVQAERALAAAALTETEARASAPSAEEPALPAWLGTAPAAELPEAPATAEALHHASAEDDLAAAWLAAHERTVVQKALRLTQDQSLGQVLAAVESIALDPAASIHPYGDTGLWAPADDSSTFIAEPAEAEAEVLHPYGDAAFRIEGLADPLPIPAPAAEDDLSAHPFGLVGLALAADLAQPVIQAAPMMLVVEAEARTATPTDILALPAPAWLSWPEATAMPASIDGTLLPIDVVAAPVQATVEAVLVEAVAVEDFGPYGDPRLWATATVEAEAPMASADPLPADEPLAAAPDLGPYGDSSLWLTLIGAEALTLAEAPAEPVAVLDAVAVPAAPAPVGIASPADARAFAGPIRTGIRRGLGTQHGLAPFEMTNRVTSDPTLYEDPPLDLLMPTPEPTGEVLSSGALEQNARLLEGVLEEFGIRGEIIDVRPGPVVTLYELEPAPGTKSSRVIGLADDIARSMSAVSARVAVVQGRNVIGIELPNQRRETVFLRELIATEDFSESKHKLAIALGKTIGGESVIVDLARMPHLLVAGTTGSGKSVAINTMILSILYQMRPEECRLIMIDPKMLELSIYEGIPHLLTPVVTDPKKAVVALKWAVREMEDRYKKMAKVGVRNIDGFNARVVEAAEKGEVITRTIQTGFNRETGEPIFETEEMELSPLPYIVVIVDEMADLMMVAGKDIEGAIQRLAQMARAAGIHLIMATQRPSVDVITGTIKANFPTRISFQVTSKIDSRTILGEQGAEQLLGQGDMLYMAGGGRISRVHGPFVSDGEVEKVVAHLKMQGHPAYLDVVVAEEGADDGKGDASDDKPVFDKTAMASAGGDDDSDLYDQAVKVVLRDKKCSTSYIQRRLAVGYNKAASLVERMEKEGIVGQANNAGKREILVYSRDLRYSETRDGED